MSPVSIGGDSLAARLSSIRVRPCSCPTVKAWSRKEDIGESFSSNGGGCAPSLWPPQPAYRAFQCVDGAYAKSGDYYAGGDFVKFPLTSSAADAPKNEVGSTASTTDNQMVTFAFKDHDQLIEFKANYQYVPYQLYPNQRMDMLDNTQVRPQSALFRTFAGAMWRRAPLATRRALYELWRRQNVLVLATDGDERSCLSNDGMPMYTKTDTYGNSSKADINLSAIDVLRAG